MFVGGVGWGAGSCETVCEKERSMGRRLLRRRAQALLGEGRMGLRAAAAAVQLCFNTHREGLDGVCVAWR